MSKFRFKDYVFHNLFPFWFQEKDSYKDKNGKGILQRLMEVCSDYFDTHIIDDETNQPGLDNILDLIDYDTTPELFLNYLWEFMGEIPYAYGLIIQNKPYDKDDLRDWLKQYSFPKTNPRELLKYAVSLYKIRGTSEFYEILGRFYGMNLTMIETENGGTPGTIDDTIPSYDHLVLATYTDEDEDEVIHTYSLSSEEIRAPYPEGNCVSCIYFLVKVSLTDVALWEKILADDELAAEAKEIIAALIEKYLPIHCKIGRYDDETPKVIFDGEPTRDEGSFDDSFDDSYDN